MFSTKEGNATTRQSDLSERSSVAENGLSSRPVSPQKNTPNANLSSSFLYDSSEQLRSLQSQAKVFQNMRDEILSAMAPKLRSWGDALENQGWRDITWSVGGAMKCDHFMGPKKTRNPAREGESFIEIDYRLLVPDHINPINEESKHIISAATGLHWEKDYSVDKDSNPIDGRWGFPDPHSIFYGYVPIKSLNNLEVEIELCVLRASESFEVADYWHQIFTPEEISWQKLSRAILRAGEFHNEVRELKKYQCNDARQRILIGYASGIFEKDAPPAFSRVPLQWHEWPEPDPQVIASLSLPEKFRSLPEPPQWVKEGREDARKWKDRFTSS